jgi:hypothetical protein
VEIDGLRLLENRYAETAQISDLVGIFPTESEAVAFGLQAGKDWIDSQPAAAKDLNKSEFVQLVDP